MYDATIGRFFSEDPIGLDADDLNLYWYVENDPINSTDPSGLGEPPTETEAQRRSRLTEQVRGHRPAGTGNTGLERHDAAIGRKLSEREKSATTKEAAEAAKRQGQEQFERSKKLRQVHEESIESSLKEIDKDRRELEDQRRKLKNPNCKSAKSIQIPQKLDLLDEESMKIAQLKEAVKRVPDGKLADEISGFVKREPRVVGRYFKKVVGVLGRGVAVGSFVFGIINFGQTAAEAGVARGGRHNSRPRRCDLDYRRLRRHA